MDKVQDFLKKHVQWIALGIGGLIFMWAVWTYVISQKSITAQINNVDYGPGQIDKQIADTSASDLRDLIDGPTGDIGDVNINLVQNFAGKVAPNREVPPLAIAVLPPPSPELADIENIDPLESGPIEIDRLPTVAPLTLVDAESGRQTVAVPVPETEDETRTENLSSVIVRYRLPMQELGQRFASVGLPDRLGITSVLDVRLMRERRGVDGEWIERTEIPLLRNATFDRMPPESATLEEKATYAAWAKLEENAGTIVQPPFYALDFGDEPATLALGEGDEPMDDEADDAPEERFVNGIRPGFDATDRSTWPPISEMTKEERDAIKKAREGQGGQDGPYGPYGPGGGYGGYGGQGGGYGPGGYFGGGGGPGGPQASSGDDDGTIYASFQSNGRRNGAQNQGQRQSDPQGGPPAGYNPYGEGGYNPYGQGGYYGGYGGAGGEFGGPDGYNPYGENQQPDGPAARRSVSGVPGEFAPATYGGDVEGWAFDETVIPGETYRYNVVYSVRNPVFNTQDFVDKEAMTSQLAITVEMDDEWESRWGQPVTVKKMSDWFMKSVLPGRNARVQFDVFRWQDGQWQKETFAIGPGDLLGGDRNGVNYVTDRVLVDIRTIVEGGREQQVAVLMDPDGRFTTHDASEDESAAYDELEDQANNAVAGR